MKYVKYFDGFLTPDTRLAYVSRLASVTIQFVFVKQNAFHLFSLYLFGRVCVCLNVLNFPIFTVHMSLGESEINLKRHRISPKLNLRTGVFARGRLNVFVGCQIPFTWAHMYLQFLSLSYRCKLLLLLFLLPFLLNVPPSRMKIIESS